MILYNPSKKASTFWSQDFRGCGFCRKPPGSSWSRNNLVITLIPLGALNRNRAESMKDTKLRLDTKWRGRRCAARHFRNVIPRAFRDRCLYVTFTYILWLQSIWSGRRCRWAFFRSIRYIFLFLKTSKGSAKGGAGNSLLSSTSCLACLRLTSIHNPTSALQSLDVFGPMLA